MATKTNNNNVPADETVIAAEKEIARIEAELKEVLQANQPGFSQSLGSLVDSAKSAWGKLQGARSDQAKQTAIMDDFTRTSEAYASKKRQADRVAILTNRALLLLVSVHQYEEDLAEEAHGCQLQMEACISSAYEIDKTFYEQINALSKDVEETLAGELKSREGRAEVFGQPVLPSVLRESLIRARRNIKRAMRSN